MGHSHTSAQLGRQSDVFIAGSGAARSDSQRDANGAAVRPPHGGAPVRLLLAFLRAYQVFLSPFYGATCRFYPSCSNYAYEAIERWGVRRGAWLALHRLLRCRPFSPGGYDPVPKSERGER
jgi:uncharacterized protein